MPCCQFLTEDELDSAEADGVIDCDTCPVAAALDDLDCDGRNKAAWRLFQQAVNRFTVNTHTVQAVLDRLTEDMDARTYVDLLERFAVLYDALCPEPDRQNEEPD